MNKMEANLSLFIITLLAAVQYIFLVQIPDSVPHFAFLCVTNLLGFLMTLAFFFGELFRLDLKQVKQSMVLALELIVFNVFLLLGVPGVGPTMADSILSTDFVFISLITFVLYRQLADRGTLCGVVLVFLGMFLMADARMPEFWNRHVLYLLVAEVAFACYLLSIGLYSPTSNPSIIAMGQMFFCFLFSLVFWAGECAFFGRSFSLPLDSAFWSSVVYISLFIRGLYGVVQIYAQRYASPLTTSLIFSTEIVMTLFLSPLMTRLFDTAPERITWLRIIGSVLILVGVLVADSAFLLAAKDWMLNGKKRRNTGQRAGARKGGRTMRYLFYAALCATLLGVWGSLIGDASVALLYGLMGALAGIPIAILLEGVLHVGFLKDDAADAAFSLKSGSRSLSGANEILEQAAVEQGIGMKRVFETQSCLEELAIRIFDAQPDAEIRARLQFSEAISAWLSWSGEKRNPLYIGPGEDDVAVAGLKIIKHRALQASFRYRDGENRLHVVI